MNPNDTCDKELSGEGWGFLKALHPEDRDRYLAQQLQDRQPYEIEYRLLAADGSYHWFVEQATSGAGNDWVVTCTPKSQFSKEQEFLKALADLKDELLVQEQAAQTEFETSKRKHDEFLKALQESEERYRSLVVATSQIVWTTDAEGQVVDVPTWRAYTGQTEADVKGWGWLEAVHPQDREHTTKVWSEAVCSKSLYDTEYRIRAADGSYRYFAARGVPVLAEDGSVREWVGVCTDIEERKATEAVLKTRAQELVYLTAVLSQTNTALEKRNQELDQFAYVASHDLKAPLRAIANLSQWIEEDISDTLNEENRYQMQLLRGRVHRLEALIDGLLQYSRVGRVEIKAESVDIKALVAEVVSLLSPPPETVSIEPGMPTLFTQRLPLFQVFINLISNAIKHHHGSQAKVTVAVADRGTFYDFAVTDNGPGIAPEYHEKVFGIFQTLEARDKVENTGIGLAIVKKIVEGQGGTISVESQEGQGATFRFTWSKKR